MTLTVNVREAKTHLSTLLEQAHADQEIVLDKACKPYVRLMPLVPTPAPSTASTVAPGRSRDRRLLRAPTAVRTGRLGRPLMRLLLDTHALLCRFTADP